MTTHPLTPEAEAGPLRCSADMAVVASARTGMDTASASGLRTPAGSTSESRLADILARLADADAITACDISAWDRLQERRSA